MCNLSWTPLLLEKVNSKINSVYNIIPKTMSAHNRRCCWFQLLLHCTAIMLQIRGPTLALRPRAATSHADDYPRVGATHHRVMSGRRRNAAQPLATGGSELGRRTSGSHRGMHAFRQRGVLLTTFVLDFSLIEY